MANVEESVYKQEGVEVNLDELGGTGLNRFGGKVEEERLKQLRGRKGIVQYREMKDNDSMVGAMLFVVKMLMRQVDWDVVGGESEEDRVFVEGALGDMEHSFSETISSILSFLPFGFSVHEIVWKKREGESEERGRSSKFDDGRIGWKKFAPRGQETIKFLYDDNNNLIAIEQRAPIDEIIPIEKVLLFRTSLGQNNPRGRSILRTAWRSWTMKKNFEEIEGIGAERDVGGIPVVWVPENIADPTTDAEKDAKKAYENLVKNIRIDEQAGVVMPQDYTERGDKKYDLQLLSAPGDKQFDLDKIIQRYDTRILQTVMADFIMLGASKRGSFALSKSKTDLFGLGISAFLDIIQDRFNEKAIPKLFKVNGIDREPPKLKHGKIIPPSLDELGDYIAKLTASGASIFPDEDVEESLLSRADINKGDGDTEQQSRSKTLDIDNIRQQMNANLLSNGTKDEGS